MPLPARYSNSGGSDPAATRVHRRRLDKADAPLPQALAACASGVGAASGRTDGRPAKPTAKVLRYAFRVAETGFDPAQISDLYSRTVPANIFEAPLTYDYLARPARMRPNTAAAMPEVSADFTALHLPHPARHLLRRRPGLQGQAARADARTTTSIRSSATTTRAGRARASTCCETAQILGLTELRKQALEGQAASTTTARSTACARSTATRFAVPLGRAAPALPSVPRRPRLHRRGGARGGRGLRRPRSWRTRSAPARSGWREWRRSSRIVLERNPHYREDVYDEQPAAGDAQAQALAARLQGRTLPMIDRVEISIIEENQPRWLSFLNGEHDLRRRAARRSSPTSPCPNDKLAPQPGQARHRRWTARRAPSVAMSLLQHGEPGGRRLRRPTRWRCAARSRWPTSVDDEIRLVRTGQAMPAQSPVAPLTCGLRPGLPERDERVQPGTRQGAARPATATSTATATAGASSPTARRCVLEMATQPDQLSRQLDELWQQAHDGRSACASCSRAPSGPRT